MLRTVTFSDKRVADMINTRFVAAWCNRGPGFKNNDLWSEKRIFESDLEAYPTKNICTFFLSPEGRVFYYVAGSYSPEFFLKILDTATSLRQALFDDGMRPRAGHLATAARLHEERAAAFESLAEKAKQPESLKLLFREDDRLTYRGKRHVHGPQCASSVREGYAYWARLHAVLEAWEELPDLEAVRYRYEYGNEFTEESPTAKHIERSDPSKPRPEIRRKPRAAQAAVQGTTRPGAPALGLPTLNVSGP